MPLPYDVEAISPSLPSIRHRRSFLVSSNLRRRLAFIIIVLFLAFVLYFNRELPLSLHTATLDLSTAEQNTYTSLPASHCPVRPTPYFHPLNSSNLYLIFTPGDPVPADTVVRRIASHEAISDECLEEWITAGTWSGACLALKLEEPRVDFVWTWVNGSDPLHRAAREAHPLAAPQRPPSSSNMEKQFRQHDELRYSLRSAKTATAGWKQSMFHLVANSFSLPLPPYEGEGKGVKYGIRLGQVPQWLDLWMADDQAPSLTLHHDVDIFRLLPSSSNDLISNADLVAWREASLPTFNSMAVESQLANLPPDDVSENTVFVMDDNYFLLPLPTSSFYSPIHGPVLQLQPDLLVNPSGNHASPPGWSEWRGLETADSRKFLSSLTICLSERFGSRGRPYLVHNARSLPLPLLHEASLAFPSAFSSTATSRFRGQDAARPESHTLWLATHFIVERHREALLWSWVVAKWGGKKGFVTRGEKHKMWLEIGAQSGQSSTKVPWPQRESRLTAMENLKAAKLPDSGITNYAFVSSDGYAYTYLPLKNHYPLPLNQDGWPDLAPLSEDQTPRTVCTVVNEECFGNDSNESAADLLKRIMVDKPTCGDCIISALINSSGSSGLSAFLPPKSTSHSESASNFSNTPPHLPLTLSSLLTFPYPANSRLFALRLIQRYSYVLGATPNKFFGASGAYDVAERLRILDLHEKNLALLCINDDLATTDSRSVADLDKALQSWMNGRWPRKMAFERDETTPLPVIDHRQLSCI
ncbi:hypothetical protein CPB84DRAFT_1734273 [Gymnopilus junonius]|uniref:Stealth protein CR3 conserved region 3 domain-containing protein n=1 Tax=Gymnopilus junonius TaxID=109634 RepID=A0A9P5NI05_GYMJU|nr:hypothetical protein CPB84DRAFT_1734273 [Gymnopilus junonius]